MMRRPMQLLPFLVFLFSSMIESIHSLQPPNNNNIGSQNHSRRDIFTSITKSLVPAAAALLTATTTSTTTTTIANAACMPGDLSVECIGVYKEYGYMSPETMKFYAPNMKYVAPLEAPSNVQLAIDMLSAQRRAADDIRDVVAAGRLEEAGIKVLNLVPKVNAASKTIVPNIVSTESTNGDSIEVNEIRKMKLEQDFQFVLGLYGEADVMIGQALRGQLGVSAVAQLMILEQLKDAAIAFDDLLVNVIAQSK